MLLYDETRHICIVIRNEPAVPRRAQSDVGTALRKNDNANSDVATCVPTFLIA